MATVTNIDDKAIKYALEQLGADGKLDTTVKIPHSLKGHMVVGERYEMFAPAAKGVADELGIIWSDDVGYSFEFAGVTQILEELYICTKDVCYGGKPIPSPVAQAFDILRADLGGVTPLCPTYIALKLIRPATDE